ncbi:unnamed protein product, partial [Ranitomeya imitator]
KHLHYQPFLVQLLAFSTTTITSHRDTYYPYNYQNDNLYNHYPAYHECYYNPNSPNCLTMTWI